MIDRGELPAKQWRAWQRRVQTILASAEELLDEMEESVGGEHFVVTKMLEVSNAAFDIDNHINAVLEERKKK